MNYQIIDIPAFKIIGIELKTTNENNKSMNDIPLHWQNFYAQNMQAQIPNKISEDILGLYTDYEGDFTKPYSLIIGCKVNQDHEIPTHMIAKTIPTAKYALFTARGPMPEQIIKTWQEIWQSNIKRSYKADFELYGDRYHDAHQPEMSIYIGIE